jgi:hypothetical protein
MPPSSPDHEDYRFLTASGADVQVRLANGGEGRSELQIFGNRAGLLSLANVVLWFVANAWRREFLTLNELPFIHCEGTLSICLRMMDQDETGQDGLLSVLDQGNHLEWAIAEDDLRRVALTVHKLVSRPGHEYDRLSLADASVTQIHIRMTDAVEWMQKGHA